LSQQLTANYISEIHQILVFVQHWYKKKHRHCAPSMQANSQQNGGILFATDFYMINTNIYFSGSTYATFESQDANTAGREE